jgi:hypothetical protein
MQDKQSHYCFVNQSSHALLCPMPTHYDKIYVHTIKTLFALSAFQAELAPNTICGDFFIILFTDFDSSVPPIVDRKFTSCRELPHATTEQNFSSMRIHCNF